MDPTQIPPEIMALLAQLQEGGEAQLMEDPLAAQYATAGKMRQTQMPITNDAGRGGIVAANPMQQAAAAIQQYRGGQEQRAAMDKMKQGVGSQGNAYKALMMAKLAELLRGQQAPPPAAPGQAMGGDPTGAFPGP